MKNVSTKRYDLIYADPPWRYDDATPNRAIENHYPTMGTEDICDMGVSIPAFDDCVLYMWATAPKIIEALAVIDAWGFKYRTHAIWDKVKIGMGYWFRGQHELLLVATKGDTRCPPPGLRISSVIRCPRGAHSRKPDYVRDMIAKWYPNSNKLEMFSRIEVDGWDSFGNQVETDLLSKVGVTAQRPAQEGSDKP